MARVTFIIFSNSLTYKLLVPLFPWFENNYYPLQFLFAFAEPLFVICISEDLDVFQHFWDKHKKLRKIFERVLHFCTCLIWGLYTAIIALPSIIFHEKREYTYYRETCKNEIIAIDKKPLIIRCLMIPACISMIWTIANLVGPLSAEANETISEIINYLIPSIDIPFICLSHKKSLSK